MTIILTDACFLFCHFILQSFLRTPPNCARRQNNVIIPQIYSYLRNNATRYPLFYRKFQLLCICGIFPLWPRLPRRFTV